MNKTQKFIAILYDILEVNFIIIENSAYQQIIHWTENGRAFIIEKKLEFSERIMQESFSTQKYNSFLRQLGVYGFKMRKNEKNKKVYFHPYFTKGNKFTLYKIQRKRKSNNEESIHAINENIKQQLIHLKIEQSHLLNQFRIQCQIQQRIATKVHFIIDHFSQQIHARYREKYWKPIKLFSSLLLGHIPELNESWIDSLLASDPRSPVLDICSSPLFLLFS